MIFNLTYSNYFGPIKLQDLDSTKTAIILTLQFLKFYYISEYGSIHKSNLSL